MQLFPLLSVTVISLLLMTTVWAEQELLEILPWQVAAVCSNGTVSYATYFVVVDKGSLRSILLTEKSAYVRDKDKVKRSSSPSSPSIPFNTTYDANNSCPVSNDTSNTTRHTSCNIGVKAPVALMSPNTEYCLVLDNTNTTESAFVDVKYRFGNDSAFKINQKTSNAAAIGLSNTLLAYSIISLLVISLVF
ncbi:hypothetical protein BDF19DRAFT_445255, partial [Syncephalis fuscata]